MTGVYIKKALVLADLHIPFCNNDLLEKTLEFGKKFKPDEIILLGDILDCYAISKFDTSPNRADDFDYERTLARETLSMIRRKFEYAKIIFICGNHEARIPKILCRGKNRAFYNMPEFKIENILSLDKYKIIYEPKMYKLNDNFIAFHGVCCGINPAVGELTSRLCNGISGHAHKKNIAHRSGQLNKISWYSVPCLADIEQLEYAADFNHKWDMGFATICYTDNSHKVDIYITDKKGKLELHETK